MTLSRLDVSRSALIVVTLKRCLSQEASGAFDAGQFPLGRLVLSITKVVV